MTASFNTQKVRAIFLSDIHLGTRGCQASRLLDFMYRHECDQLYLVGDIIDGWYLKKAKWFWPKAHEAFVAHVFSQARAGVKVTYITGNHDEFLRPFENSEFAGIAIKNRIIHTAADGERYLVIHGDQFDVISNRVRWLAVLGDVAYHAILAANTRVNQILGCLGLPFWPLSAWIKHHIKRAVNFIGDYEATVAAEAERLKLRGIICGHIHHAAIHDELGIRYINTGDWVESCTAVVEHFDGGFEIVRWAHKQRQNQIQRLPRLSLIGIYRFVRLPFAKLIGS